MQNPYIWPMLQETSSIWLSIVLISILFYFIIIKVKFQKKSSLNAYATLLYSFVFFSLSALSFVVLNAADTFFRIQDDLYGEFLWLFPFAIVSALFGALIGWIIYYTATKVAAAYTLLLLHGTLILVIPSLLFSLLITPLKQTFSWALTDIKPLAQINPQTPEWEEAKPTESDLFIAAAPAQLYDSLMISMRNGNRVFIENPLNGFSYTQPVKIQPVEQIYVIANKAFRQLNLLLTTNAVQGQSQLMVLDSLGNIVFSKEYTNGVNRLSLSTGNNMLMLQRETQPDSLKLEAIYKVRP